MKNSSINQKKINEIVDDEVIIKQFFERDERAIVNIEQKYGKYCYSIAFRILLNEKDTEEYNFCNRNFTMGYAGTVRICSRQYRTVERHNCKYNDQLSADRGWNTDNLQR